MIATYLNCFRNTIKEIVKNLENKNRMLNLLDVGCGNGEFTLIFKTKFNRLYGIDTFQSKDLRKEIKFILADAKNLPFLNNSFDLIISFDVIEHIEDDVKFVKELFSVLKENGKAIIGTPNKSRLFNAILRLLNRERVYPWRVDPKRLSEYGPCIHIREYTGKEFIDLFEQCGFVIDKEYKMWFGLLPLNYGLVRIPKFLRRYCHYLIVVAKKSI